MALTHPWEMGDHIWPGDLPRRARPTSYHYLHLDLPMKTNESGKKQSKQWPKMFLSIDSPDMYCCVPSDYMHHVSQNMTGARKLPSNKLKMHQEHLQDLTSLPFRFSPTFALSRGAVSSTFWHENIRISKFTSWNAVSSEVRFAWGAFRCRLVRRDDIAYMAMRIGVSWNRFRFRQLFPIWPLISWICQLCPCLVHSELFDAVPSNIHQHPQGICPSRRSSPHPKCIEWPRMWDFLQLLHTFHLDPPSTILPVDFIIRAPSGCRTEILITPS